MKKLITFIMSLIFFITLSVLCKMYYDYFSMDYKKTEAIITDIVSPDGIVYGEFTDINGVFHSDAEMYLDYQGHKADASSHIGEKVTILYDYQKDECMNYKSFLYTILFNISVCLFSGICLAVIFVLDKRKSSKGIDDKE